MSKPTNFDRLASAYRGLEYLAFGRDLERARFCFLDELQTCQSILVLGEGDGRCLARLVTIARGARIHCVDASAAMLAAAAARLAPADRSRVEFTMADARTVSLSPHGYDAVITFFFFDCFTEAEVGAIITRIRPRLSAQARWLFADFVLPAGGWAKVRARLWLFVLYTFFRWQTHLPIRALPPSEAALERAGFRRHASRELQHGLLRTAVFRSG
jgi:SAM-dependent methyltransferase